MIKIKKDIAIKLAKLFFLFRWQCDQELLYQTRICLFDIKDNLRQFFITPYFSRAFRSLRTTILEGTSSMWTTRKREITNSIESKDGALLKTKLLIRCLYEKERENLHFDIPLTTKGATVSCTKALIYHEDYFSFFAWFANFTYQFLAHFLASLQNL